MKNSYFFVFLLTSIVAFGQQTFSPGYYLDQNNTKIVGFIEDSNPYNNPDKIYFKTSLDSQSNEISIYNIKEFKIDTDYKYVKFKVDYDNDQVVNKSEISIYGKDPNLMQKVVLLKVLVEGKVSLYKAIIDDAVFFYVKDENDENPKLLVHRKYNVQNSIVENNDFRKELYGKMKSEKFVLKDFLNIKYEEKELLTLFKRFNGENNSLVEQNVDLTRDQNKFYYKVFGGLSLFTAPYNYNQNYDLKSNYSASNPIVGFEFSNVLGVNSNRSEVFGRLFYQKVKTESKYHSDTNAGYNIDYVLNSNFSSLNLTVGYRYALVKMGKNKLCIDGSLGMTRIMNGDFSIDYTVTYTGPNPNNPIYEQTTFKKHDSLNLFFNVGLGYVINNKYALNVEYSTPKNYLNSYAFLSGGYSNFNLIFTYTLNK